MRRDSFAFLVSHKHGARPESLLTLPEDRHHIFPPPFVSSTLLMRHQLHWHYSILTLGLAPIGECNLLVGLRLLLNFKQCVEKSWEHWEPRSQLTSTSKRYKRLESKVQEGACSCRRIICQGGHSSFKALPWQAAVSQQIPATRSWWKGHLMFANYHAKCRQNEGNRGFGSTWACTHAS